MADGTVLDPGVGGDTVATAEATFAGTAKKVQVIGFGIVSGSAGAFVYTLSPGGAGAVTGGVPRFTLASDDPAVLALQVIDDWDESDRCKVNPIAGQVGLQGGAGVVTALTLRVAIATDANAVSLAASEVHLGEVGGKGKTVSASVTRPADTNVYGAGDAVTNSTSAPVVITFDACGRIAGGSGWINGATLIDTANQPTKASLELWIFKGSSAPTPDNDNAVFTPTDAELENLVCVIVFDTAYIGDATSGAGGNCVFPGRMATDGPARFKCDAANDDLFGLLVVRNAYTPVSAEKFTAILEIDQD